MASHCFTWQTTKQFHVPVREEEERAERHALSFQPLVWLDRVVGRIQNVFCESEDTGDSAGF